MDMDGVLVHEETAVPGADRFLARLRELGLPFLVLTNNSIYTRRDLAARLASSGLDVPEEAHLDVCDGDGGLSWQSTAERAQPS